ncbi:MAG: carboxypeptidase-like regulatory domain-containing protein [Planctomycetes bacterium]|nr:carboxypeptidase-like regulatory domain-containing protein [Planctomycetota bacterium]
MRRPDMSGMAAKGPIANADVSVDVKLQNEATVNFANVTTDANGHFTVSGAIPDGVVTVKASGGSYVDESTGTTVNLTSNQSIRAKVNWNASTNANIAVTPLTEAAVVRAEALVDLGWSEADAAAQANAEISAYFGVDIVHTMPADPTDAGSSTRAEAEIDYGIILAGITQLNVELGGNSEDAMLLVELIAKDISDSEVDGEEDGEVLLFLGANLPSDSASHGLLRAIANFEAGPRNQGFSLSGQANAKLNASANAGGLADHFAGIYGKTAFSSVAESSIHARVVPEDGGESAFFGETRSNAKGYFSIGVTVPEGVIEATSSGGFYIDQATSQIVQLESTDSLRARLRYDSETSADLSARIMVTPLTEIAVARADALIEAGLTASDATVQANSEVSEYFGVEIVGTLPADTIHASTHSRTEAEVDYGMILSGFSQLNADLGGQPSDLKVLIELIAEDFADGMIDAKADGEAQIFLGATLPVDAGGEALINAIATFEASSRNAGFSLSMATEAALNAGAEANCLPNVHVSFEGDVSFCGPVLGATVDVRVISGAQTITVGTASTDSSGHFSVQGEFPYGVLQVESTGGAYIDHATGDSVALSLVESFRAEIACTASTSTAISGEIAVTPLTTFAAARADALVLLGSARAEAVTKANAEISAYFGVDITGVMPANPTDSGASASTQAELDYGLIIAGISQLNLDLGGDAEDSKMLVGLIALDLADGTVDGKASGTSLPFLGVDLTADAAGEALISAIASFEAGTRNAGFSLSSETSATLSASAAADVLPDVFP